MRRRNTNGLAILAGGLAFVGSTGEDYAIPYLNAIVLDSEDPAEISIAGRLTMPVAGMGAGRSFTTASMPR